MNRLFIKLFIILGLTNISIAQNKIGVLVGVGDVYTQQPISKNMDYALLRNDQLSLVTTKLFFQKAFPKWALELAGGYDYVRTKFEDKNVVNFSKGLQTANYITNFSNLNLSLGLIKRFRINDKWSFDPKFGIESNFWSNNTNSQSQAIYYDGVAFNQVVTTKTMPFSLGIVPQIAFTKKMNDKWDMSIYGSYYVGVSEAFNGASDLSYSVLSFEQGTFNSNNSNYQLGMKVGFFLNKKDKAPKIVKEKKSSPKKEKETPEPTNQKSLEYDENGLPKTLDKREIVLQREIEVNSTEIEFHIWDDKQEDQDSISLYINGEWVLTNYEIIKKKKVVKITIDPNKDNYLIMYALNEGKYPPNTCAIAIFDRKNGERRLNLKSTMKSCGAIRFRYKE